MEHTPTEHITPRANNEKEWYTVTKENGCWTLTAYRDRISFIIDIAPNWMRYLMALSYLAHCFKIYEITEHPVYTTVTVEGK